MKKILVILSLLLLVIAACQPIITENKTGINNQSEEVQKNQQPETQTTVAGSSDSKGDLSVEEEGGVSVVKDYNSTIETSTTKTQDSQETQQNQEQPTSKEDEYLGLTGEVFVVESVEGKLVKLNPKAEDPDGDLITYSFSEPFNSKGEWQTKIGDAGKYRVTITASDGKSETSEDILVVIKRANRAPEINCKKNMVVNEGDLIKLQCEITDVDNDSLIIGYSGWMTSDTYQTTFDDEGKYNVQVSAADATHKTTENISITVLNVNRPPVINSDFPKTISVKEGNLIKIDTSKIFDPDGDNLTFTFSEPFNESGEWTPKEGDAGVYYAEVIVSDGKESITKQINIDVAVKNRPPVFVALS